MIDDKAMSDDRKTYYVSVGGGQVLADKEAAANFEFEIRANEEELNKLQELFEETASADEAAMLHFVRPITTRSLDEMNEGYDYQLQEIYKLLYKLGTEETKRHIESIRILPEDGQAGAKLH